MKKYSVIIIFFFLTAASLLFPDAARRLKFDLFFSESDYDPNYVFSLPGKVVIDKNSNLYISDLKESVIRKYDKNGKYVCSFGKRGNGPGEILGMSGLEALKNYIAVMDYKTIHYFGYDGKYIKSVDKSYGRMHYVYHYHFPSIFLVYEIDTQTRKFVLSLRDINDKLIREIYSFSAEGRFEAGEHYWFPCFDFEKVVFGVNSKEDIIYAYSEAFEVFKTTGNKTVSIIKENAKPVSIPGDIRKKLDFVRGGITINGVDKDIKFTPPENYSLIQDLIIDENDNIWLKVRTPDFYGFKKYSSKGKKLAEYSMDYDAEYISPEILISGGYIYMRQYNQYEGLKILRARL